jgi:hypothetical protein
MQWLKGFFLKAGPPVLAWGLSLAVPAIPQSIWLAIINAVLSGNVTLAHLEEFLKAHGVKVYATEQPGDLTPIYPEGKNSGL